MNANKFIISNEENNQKIIPRNPILLRQTKYHRCTHRLLRRVLGSGRFGGLSWTPAAAPPQEGRVFVFASQSMLFLALVQKGQRSATDEERDPEVGNIRVDSGTVCFYCGNDLIYLYLGICRFFLPCSPAAILYCPLCVDDK